MAEQTYYMGVPQDLTVDEHGNLVITFESGNQMAGAAPDWLKELDPEAQQRWRAIAGGLYWPEVDETVQLPELKVDREKLVEAIREAGGDPDDYNLDLD